MINLLLVSGMGNRYGKKAGPAIVGSLEWDASSLRFICFTLSWVIKGPIFIGGGGSGTSFLLTLTAVRAVVKSTQTAGLVGCCWDLGQKAGDSHPLIPSYLLIKRRWQGRWEGRGRKNRITVWVTAAEVHPLAAPNPLHVHPTSCPAFSANCPWLTPAPTLPSVTCGRAIGACVGPLVICATCPAVHNRGYKPR